jgi:hypothetical protein
MGLMLLTAIKKVREAKGKMRTSKHLLAGVAMDGTSSNGKNNKKLMSAAE